MNNIHYIGLDVHKKSISFCVKAADGQVGDTSRKGNLRTLSPGNCL